MHLNGGLAEIYLGEAFLLLLTLICFKDILLFLSTFNKHNHCRIKIVFIDTADSSLC